MRKKITYILFLALMFGCKDSKNGTNPISFEDSIDFLVHKLDKSNVKLYEDQTIVEVKFELLDRKKCECEYSYRYGWNNSSRKISKFNLIDAYYISPNKTGGGIFGVVEIRFEKESVFYGTSETWGDEVTIYTTDSDVNQIGKAFENLKNICAKKNKSDLFSE
ncbi:hypothetical protein [Winogradskyella poriferorum]|uniref:Lipoprotein n=1 Tax=Winogradskyella poriferorum TaxID=307627 RepID=A0ABU7W819_9FLAO